MLPPPCFPVGMVPGLLQTWCLAFRPNSSILVSSDQRILFLIVWESLGAFWKTPSWLSCDFYWGVASVWPLYHNGLFGRMLQRWLSFWKVLPSPQRSSVRVTIGFLVTSLPKALLPRLLSLAWRPALRKRLCGSKRLPFKNDAGHCVLGDLQCCRHFLCPSPVLCLNTNLSRSSTDHSFDLMAWFLLWHALSTVRPLYRQVCAFPNHVQSIKFTTGGL